VPTIKLWVENNLYLVGGVAVGVAISLMVILRLSKTLEEQISQQKALWNQQ